MFEKPVKFGEILVREEVITKDQLAEVLEAQKKTRKEFGLLISQMYSIPVEVVESLYVSEVLVPSMKWSLLQKLIEKFEGSSIEPETVIENILVNISQFSSYLAVKTYYTQDSAARKKYSIVDRSEKLKRIQGKMDKLVLKLKHAESFLLFTDVQFEFVLKNQELIFSNPGFISEVRLKLLQAVKQAQ